MKQKPPLKSSTRLNPLLSRLSVRKHKPNMNDIMTAMFGEKKAEQMFATFGKMPEMPKLQQQG